MSADPYGDLIMRISEALPRVEAKLQMLHENFDRLEIELDELAGNVTTLTRERDKLVGGAGVFFTIATTLGGLLFWFLDRIALK